MNQNIKILLLANYWQTFGFTLLAPLYALFVVNHIGGNEFLVGLTYSVYGISAGLFIILFGRVEDHLRRYAKQILVAGYLLIAITSFAYIFIETIPQLIMLQIAYAFSIGIYIPVNKTLYSKLEDKGKESSEWALLDGGNFLIIGLASLIGGWLVTRFGFDTLFIAMGISQLIAGLFACSLASSSKT